MGIQLSCDRCKRFMKIVSVKDIKNLTADDCLCKVCLDTEPKLKKDIDQLKQRAQNTFIQHANKLKELVDEAITKRIAEE